MESTGKLPTLVAVLRAAMTSPNKMRTLKKKGPRKKKGIKIITFVSIINKQHMIVNSIGMKQNKVWYFIQIYDLIVYATTS